MAKCGIEWGDWCSGKLSSHGSGLWKGIWLGRGEFWRWISFNVGCGPRVRFWIGGVVSRVWLVGWFPLVFQIADRQDVEVASYLSIVDGRMVWDVKLRQSMFDWEVDQLVDLLAELYGLRLRLRCKGAKGVFFVSSFYRYS